MALLNARNLRKAKQLLEQNRHKVGDVVGKAAAKLDEVSNGKTGNLGKKAEEAARKYSAGGATHHGVHPDAVSDGQNLSPISEASTHPSGEPAPQSATQSAMSKEELQLRQTEANIAAANAVTAAAQAASDMLNRAAEMQGKIAADGAEPLDGTSPSGE